MLKIAIIGANEFQEPLILKAKECGYETHVFAWEKGAVGKASADYFYPISIVEKEKILEKCKEIGIAGICSIGSDLAVLTVNYIAEKLGLNSNSVYCSRVATNKYEMRNLFKEKGDPIPKYRLTAEGEDSDISDMTFPMIVKPTDRAGSRGITKVTSKEQIPEAIKLACENSFEKKALIEEFIKGKEYSIECISYHGKHTLLAITEKITTGAPHFIETGHNEPADISQELRLKIEKIIFHALDSLSITDGASHPEIMIDENEKVTLVEIGSRMGGDCIGSDLVRISTGYDYTKMVLDIALNKQPDFTKITTPRRAYVRFILSPTDIDECEKMLKKGLELERKFIDGSFDGHVVTDSSNRYGYYIMKGEVL